MSTAAQIPYRMLRLARDMVKTCMVKVAAAVEDTVTILTRYGF